MQTYNSRIVVNRFHGIRTVNAIADVENTGQLSAETCQNIDFKYTNNGSGVGIYSQKGSSVIAEISGKIIYGQWESIQNGVSYWIVYAIDETKGYLYHFKPSSNSFDLIYDQLTPVKACNGLTMVQGFDDLFIFTNGIDDYLSIRMTADEKVKKLNAVDAEERPIRGLCLKTQNGRLITNSGNRIHWSKTSDIYDWSSSTVGVKTNPAYQEFDRNITAIETYGNCLIVFTDTYSVQFCNDPGDDDFSRTEATGGGCAGFKSIIKYDNKIFYYDPVARNIFAYYLFDSGQTRTTEGVANDVLKYLSELNINEADDIIMIGLSIEDRSEIWIKFPSIDGQIVLIFDYLKNEWTERKMSHIHSLALIEGKLYSSVDSKILEEYSGYTYNGQFQSSEYLSQVINLKSDTNLKIPKMPLILTLDDSCTNNFMIEFILDDSPQKLEPKRIEKSGGQFLIWANEDGSIGGEWAEDDGSGGYYWNYDDVLNTTYNVFGLVPFQQMRLRIYTQEEGDEFGIKRIELKKIRVKTKMLGK